MKTKVLALAVLVVAGTALFVPVQAANEDVNVPDTYDGGANVEAENRLLGPDEWSDKNLPGADCMDYYKFPGVQVNIGTVVGPYVSGEKVTFSGTLVNDNDYPVVDGQLFVRIGLKNFNEMTEGNYIADEFFALEKVNLDAREEKAVQFGWSSPQDLPSGEYKASYFFTAGKKFNLSGLSFTNEVTGGGASFRISGQNKEKFRMDRSRTSFNDKPYNHIGNWSEVEAGSKVVFEQPILNLTAEEQQVQVHYDLYYWDGLDEKNRIENKFQMVTLPAGGTGQASFTIPAIKEPVYYLRITASSGTQKSIVNLRLVSRLDRPRLNFPALTKFPIAQGEKFELFSCYQNPAGKLAEGRMVVTLKNDKNEEIGKLEYKGRMVPEVRAEVKEITAASNLDYLRLEAVLYGADGKTADNYEAVYDCRYFGKCSRGVSGLISSGSKALFFKPVVYVFLIFTLILVAFIVVYYRRKKGTPGTGAGALLLLLSVGILFGPLVATAGAQVSESMQINASSNYTHYFGSLSGDHRKVTNGTVTAHHEVTRTPASNSLVTGNTVTFSWDEATSRVEFSANAGFWDTPFGYGGNPKTTNWLGVGDAAQPAWSYVDGQGADSDYVELVDDTGSSSSSNKAKISFTAEKPNDNPNSSYDIYVSSSAPAVINCPAGSLTCTATGTGNATLTLHIPEVRTRIYSVVVHDGLCGASDPRYLKRVGSCFNKTLSDGSIQRTQKFWIGEAWKVGNYNNSRSILSVNRSALAVGKIVTLPAKTYSWTISVGAPPLPPNLSIGATADGTNPVAAPIEAGDAVTINWNNAGGALTDGSRKCYQGLPEAEVNCVDFTDNNFADGFLQNGSTVQILYQTTRFEYAGSNGQPGGNSPQSVTVVVNPPTCTNELWSGNCPTYAEECRGAGGLLQTKPWELIDGNTCDPAGEPKCACMCNSGYYRCGNNDQCCRNEPASYICQETRGVCTPAQNCTAVPNTVTCIKNENGQVTPIPLTSGNICGDLPEPCVPSGSEPCECTSGGDKNWIETQ